MIRLLEEGMRQHQLGQLDEAEAIYRRVLAATPGDVDALHYLGVLQHQKGQSDTAARLIRKAISRCPDYVDAHKNLGNVLQESGKLEKAERCYRKAIELQPGDPDAHTNLSVVLRLLKRYEEAVEASLVAVNNNANNPIAWLHFGRALKAGRMIDAAVSAFYRALDIDNQMVEAHNELCHTLYHAETLADMPADVVQERINAYQNWLSNEPDNPVVNFMLAACRGEKSFARAPDPVVKSLFDGFAVSFEQNLAVLGYSVPGLIGKLLERTYPGIKGEMAILDAGCGTGLCAEFLKPLASSLLGVDLSTGMLDQARKRALYDELIEAELTQKLQQDADAYDLVVCADTLCYFGDLKAVCHAVSGALKKAGRFIFSVESAEQNLPGGFRLNTSGRYSHSREYVCDTLDAAGLSLVQIDQAVLRTESAQPVQGLIVDAVKPG